MRNLFLMLAAVLGLAALAGGHAQATEMLSPGISGPAPMVQTVQYRRHHWRRHRHYRHY